MKEKMNAILVGVGGVLMSVALMLMVGEADTFGLEVATKMAAICLLALGGALIDIFANNSTNLKRVRTELKRMFNK